MRKSKSSILVAAIAVATVVMLLSQTGCFVRTVTLYEKRFDTLDELKSAAGDDLSYPSVVPPAGFEPAYTEITGYDDYITWNYRIVIHQYDKYPGLPAARPEKGAPVTANIKIYAFVPREPHPLGGKVTRWPNEQEETDMLNYFNGRLTDEEPWELGGFEVRHYCYVSLEHEPDYAFAESYAGFMRGNLLYIVKAYLVGDADEDFEIMRAEAERAAAAIITDMIGSTEPSAEPALPS